MGIPTALPIYGFQYHQKVSGRQMGSKTIENFVKLRSGTEVETGVLAKGKWPEGMDLTRVMLGVEVRCYGRRRESLLVVLGSTGDGPSSGVSK